METDHINDRWTINRIGLINFWYYDEEEFNFLDGRLLLRGSNGSGKSVTMQSFIPLLLDGNKNPGRLDPFGSRARRLENYLLGEDEEEKEENTGYLYMEFVKKHTGNYLTIGMGLKAKKGRNLDFWGFAVTDGRRIGKDFFLYKELEEKIPLSKIELKNRIGSGGEVYDTQGEYMAMVNRLLFGFENLEDYDALIKLLVQLRTPKLSKDFKPTVIYEIMDNSLQPLSDEDLRPMSEAIENMDNIKAQLEALRESKKAADRLKAEFNRYNRFVLLEKTKDYLSSQDSLEEMLKDAQRLEEERETNQKKYLQAEEEREQFKVTQKSLEHRKQELEQHDSFKAKLEIEKLITQVNNLERDKAVKETSYQSKKKKERELQKDLSNAADRKAKNEEEIAELLTEMSVTAENLYLYEHDYFARELKEDLAKAYNFGLYRKEIDGFRKRVEESKKALEEERKRDRDYDEALEELELARREKENAARELEKTENVLAETKAEFIEQTYIWEKGNEYLKLSGESLPQVMRAVNGYGETGGYDDILREVGNQYSKRESGFNERIVNIKAVKSGLETQLQEKKADLQKWKSEQDPEPPREEKVLANRRKLGQEGIPFVPFYMAVDFQQDVPAELRGKLEEALLDMGLLDALIIPTGTGDKLKSPDPETKDRYICPKPLFFKQDLSSYLKPVTAEGSGISYEDIDNVLKSIMLNQEDECVYINENGEYSIGLLRGKTSGGYIPRFLGVEARRRYRQENIVRLEKEITELQVLIDGELQKIAELEDSKRSLKKELEAFPSKDDLETALNMVKSARLSLDHSIKEADKKENLAHKVFQELKAVRERVRELTVKLEIPLTLEAFEQAVDDVRAYRDMLGTLETIHVQLLEVLNYQRSLEEQLTDIFLDLDELNADLKKLERSIEDSLNQKRNYEELLKELNYEEIREEIETCIKGLTEIPTKIEMATSEAATFKQKTEHITEKLSDLKAQIEWKKTLNECCRESFSQEYKLGYVFSKEEQKEEQKEEEKKEEKKETDLARLARKVYGELREEEKSGKSREENAGVLQGKYHDNRQYMLEYNLIMEYIFDQTKPSNQDEERVASRQEGKQGNQREQLSQQKHEKGVRGLEERLEQVLASRKRLDFSAKVHGRDVNFFTLVNFIETSIEENEKLLRESDRQLFEDILANTVGKKIRAKIYHSEQWVKKMNGLMESMNTSSGLSFSLAWKNKAAETEEQLDTRALVEILKADAQLLSEEQMDKLSSHFRSKIAQARKEMEQKGAMQSFHAIMKDILDYRKWFEFQLFYRKTGEIKKELTNNAFDKFSGGEKAMAMYVPLFSSVYARYEGARKDSPRIISLDEAFAGVDENNIRDMFRLIEELKLNFIINSQILWGDYDTIPALSVCELVRPNNADFVTVIRYRWNGKVRELVTDNVFANDDVLVTEQVNSRGEPEEEISEQIAAVREV